MVAEIYFKGNRLPSIDCSMNGCKTKEIEVVTTNLFHDNTKVHIETLKGTIIANGILTSSICQGYDIGVETAVGVFYDDLLRNHTAKGAVAQLDDTGRCMSRNISHPEGCLWKNNNNNNILLNSVQPMKNTEPTIAV